MASIVLAIDAKSGWGGVAGLVVPLFFFVGMNGIIVANTVTGALADFPKQAGSVSALVGAIQYGSGIAGSALVGVFSDGTAWPLGWVVALGGMGCAASVWLFVPTENTSAFA